MEDLLRAMSPASGVTALGSAAGSQGADAQPVKQEADLSKLTGLFKALEVLERAIVLNTYHDKVCTQSLQLYLGHSV